MIVRLCSIGWPDEWEEVLHGWVQGAERRHGKNRGRISWREKEAFNKPEEEYDNDHAVDGSGCLSSVELCLTAALLKVASLEGQLQDVRTAGKQGREADQVCCCRDVGLFWMFCVAGKCVGTTGSVGSWDIASHRGRQWSFCICARCVVVCQDTDLLHVLHRRFNSRKKRQNKRRKDTRSMQGWLWTRIKRFTKSIKTQW